MHLHLESVDWWTIEKKKNIDTNVLIMGGKLCDCFFILDMSVDFGQQTSDLTVLVYLFEASSSVNLLFINQAKFRLISIVNALIDSKLLQTIPFEER